MGTFNKWLEWLVSDGSKYRTDKTEIEKLLMKARVTSKCLFFASKRLDSQNKFAFSTTIILSLGLILIPLLQNSGVKLHFDVRVMNMMSIFLAVAVLVYSIIIGGAHYESRIATLKEGGYRLKEFIGELGIINEKLKKEECKSFNLQKYQDKYSEILAKCHEQHEACDYNFAMLDMPRDYKLTGLPKLCLWIKAHYGNKYGYKLSVIMIIGELIFILDMIGITSIITPYLQVNK